MDTERPNGGGESQNLKVTQTQLHYRLGRTNNQDWTVVQVIIYINQHKYTNGKLVQASLTQTICYTLQDNMITCITIYLSVTGNILFALYPKAIIPILLVIVMKSPFSSYLSEKLSFFSLIYGSSSLITTYQYKSFFQCI